MDFLNKASTQLADLFRTMSPGARVVAGLLLAIVVVSLGFLMTQQSSSPDQYLFGARILTNEEIAHSTVAFGKAGLGDFDTSGNRIRVPRSQKHIYLAALGDANAMPRAPFDFDNEVGSQGNVWTNREQHEQAVKRATEQELSLIVRYMTGIDKAIVKYQVSKKNSFPRNINKITAAVSVWPQPGNSFDNTCVDSVRHMVANWIGSNPKDVEVIDMVSGERKSIDVHGPDGSGSNMYHVVQRELEEYFADKARRALSYIQEARVVVNVDLERIISEKSISQIADPQKSPTIHQEETSERTTSSTRPTKGEPGVIPNTSTNQPAQVVSRSEESGSQTVIETSTYTKALSKDYIERIKAGLVPNHATVAVSIPMSYYRTAWREAHSTPNSQQPDPPTEVQLKQFMENFNNEVKNHVSHVLPYIPSDQSKVKPISVMAFELPDVPEPASPPFAAIVGRWLEKNWSTLGMMGLGVFSLLMLRGMIRTLPNLNVATNMSEPTELPGLGVAHTDDKQEDHESPERLLNRPIGAPNLRDELAEMVRDDPDAAAKVISSWIGNAA